MWFTKVLKWIARLRPLLLLQQDGIPRCIWWRFAESGRDVDIVLWNVIDQNSLARSELHWPTNLHTPAKLVSQIFPFLISVPPNTSLSVGHWSWAFT